MHRRNRRTVAAPSKAIRPSAEPLEGRILFTAVSWTGAAGNGAWAIPSNWSTNTVPGPDDDVTIDVPGKQTISLSANFDPPFISPTVAVHSLVTAEDLSLAGATFYATNGITLKDNATIGIGALYRFTHSFAIPSTLNVGGAISGQGRVGFGADTEAGRGRLNSLGSLTIGSGITITGGFGAVGGSIVNAGLITGGSGGYQSSVANISVGGEFTNNGTLGVSGRLVLDATQFHGGTGALIAQNPDTTISIYGSFTQAGLGKVLSANGLPHIFVSGNITGGLLLDATTGTWYFGGTMTGGIFRAKDGVSLQIQGGATFDGVSLASDVTANRNVTFTVMHDLELIDNAKVHLSGGTLQFVGGHQNLVGQGEVLFEGGADPASVLGVVGDAEGSPSTLAIESGVTIRTNGGGGAIGADAASGSITSNGLILASSGTITFQGNFINQGMLRVESGGTIDLHTRYSGSGLFKVNGGTLNLSGSFMQADVGHFDRTGGQVVVTGTITGGLALNAATGSWDVNGGTFVGGTYTASDGAMLRFIGSGTARLDGLTVASDVAATGGGITVVDGLTLANNARLFLSTTLDLSSDATLAGQGAVVLSGGALRISGGLDGSLTIGPGVTIRGQGGAVTLGNADSTIINQGIIAVEAAAAALDIQGHLTNDGTVRVTAGTLQLENPSGGTGTINVGGGRLILAGTVTQAAFDPISRTGGDINLIGTVADGLALSDATGSVNLLGGRLDGGTYRATGGARLRVTADSKFDGVTVASDVDVASSVVAVAGGLTLANGAVVHLISSSALASLEFRDGNQTLGGTGEVRFEGSKGGSVRAVRYTDNTAASLTIGPDVTLRTAGGDGTIGGGGVKTSVLNQGTVSVEGAGRTITFKDTINNAGAVTLGPETTLAIATGASFNNSGIVTFQIGDSPQSGRFGRISSVGPLALDGTADVELVGGFHPAANDAYPLVQAPALTGAFDAVNGLVVDGVTLFTQNLSSTAFTVTATGGVVQPLAHVTDVFVSGSAWSSTFLQALASQGVGDSTFGYRLTADNADLPWTNLDRLSVRFDRPVDVESADLTIGGVRTASNSIAGFNYDATTNTATWTVATPLAADAMSLDLKSDGSGVTAASGGRALDGDYLGQFPSGDGSAGGDFRLRVDALPGDVNQSGGSINAADLVLTRNRVGHTAASPGSGAAAYSVFNDLNGDGIVNASDLVLVRNRIGSTLPAAPGFDYPSFANASGLEVFGDAVQSGDTLRLVPASEHHNGAVRRQGVQNLSQGFSTSFAFRYANVGGILDDSGNHGTDGMAFTIQPIGSGAPVIASGGLSIWFDAYRDGSDVSSSRVGVYLNGAQVAQFDAEAFGIRYREGGWHTAQIDSSGSAIAIRLDGHFLGHVAANLGDTGLVGFAGFDGLAYADEELSNWSFRPPVFAQPAVFAPRSRVSLLQRALSLLENVEVRRA